MARPAARMQDAPKPSAGRLRKRCDYTRVQSSRSVVRGRCLLLVQAPTPAAEPPAPSPRAGFTVSRKVGNAVVRNRVKRRLKALWAAQAAHFPARDYVFIAFASAATASFAHLSEDVRWLCRRAQASELSQPPPRPAGPLRGRAP